MFILRNLLGIRQHRSKWPTFMIGAGIFSCLAAAALALILIPANLAGGWRTAGLPRPTPAEMRQLPTGTKVLIVGHLPSDAATGESAHGLTLFYIEHAESVGDSKIKRLREPETKTVRERDIAPRLTLTLADGTQLSVRVPAQTALGNPQRLQAKDDLETVPGLRIARTYVGYLPGQSLAVQGTWEGDGLTASEFFAGNIDDYVYEVQVTRPLQMLYTALCCSGLGIAMVIGGWIVRLFRR